ncbi:hypothetical protein C2845_PM10G05980 [Panicum miliaceum]|uniref:Protein FAR1-RELATED SEQUENCE n=1 Tax=Panicum miliaceum TaxID=4540 RepID=A0A3L6PIA7_PANMI|nr:hypothetical protein C2845_PM10G05980 [Panicum miliaceum]
MSVLHFVRQYQKIQNKCLVAQDGQDFRTDDRERRRWSRYPIERHSSTVYTKNLFYRFLKEIKKTAEYDVKPEVEGCASKETYTIMDNHIRLMHSEVDEMKKKKKSSTQRGGGRRFPASVPDDGPNVHIPAAGDTCDLSEPLGLNYLPANPNVPKNAGVSAPISTIPSGNNSGGPGGNPAELDGSGAMTQQDVGNPLRSKVKGRKKEKRIKNKCEICKLIGHNATRCPDKIGIEDGQSGSMVVN